MSEQQKIRIKLKAYDHKSLDLSAANRRNSKENRSGCFRSHSASDRKGSDNYPESCT